LPFYENKSEAMILKTKFLTGFFFISILTLSLSSNIKAEEKDGQKIYAEIERISKDLKTLEKAFYKTSEIKSSSASFNNLNEDVLTRHLLKLNEIEEQFREVTNRYEEINFKLDKLSNRITKMQSDNQIRFGDLENNSTTESESKKFTVKKKNLPGTDQPQELGRVSGEDISVTMQVQKTQSVETAGLVVTEEASRSESLLPNKPPKEQYNFAVSFIKVGDYETAEFALREFIDKNKDNELAGNAQYWYGETFRIRQLYQDAASAYLDGYQNYPKSKKAPINLLKLGTTLVQLGEKEQGCLMILGVKKQYPKANKSVLQKAEYEKKKFKCSKA
jgi:tol-pal system protein YbgF